MSTEVDMDDFHILLLWWKKISASQKLQYKNKTEKSLFLAAFKSSILFKLAKASGLSNLAVVDKSEFYKYNLSYKCLCENCCVEYFIFDRVQYFLIAARKVTPAIRDALIGIFGLRYRFRYLGFSVC